MGTIVKPMRNQTHITVQVLSQRFHIGFTSVSHWFHNGFHDEIISIRHTMLYKTSYIYTVRFVYYMYCSRPNS